MFPLFCPPSVSAGHCGPWVNAVSGHVWEEHLTWYCSSVDYTKGFIIVKISNDWYYSSYTVFLFQNFCYRKTRATYCRGDSKLLCEVYNSNFVLFVHRLERTQGCSWLASHCRGHVWGPAKFYFLRDSAQNILQISAATKLALQFITTLHNSKSLFNETMLKHLH
jgi:hypothetical protein